MQVMIMAIAGGSGSGKTTFAKKIQQALGHKECALLAQDSYYIDQSHRFDQDGGSVNFDHPNAIDFVLMAAHLQALKAGQKIEVPCYDFATHKRQSTGQEMAPKKFILVDGTLILSQAILRPYFDQMVFIDVDEKTRFERRLRRDTVERGRSAEGVKAQFLAHVAPMHEAFVAPSLVHAQWPVTVENFDLELEKFVNFLRNLA